MLMPCEYLTLEENPTDKANEHNRKSKHLIKKDIRTEEADPSNDSDESDDEIPTFEPRTIYESDDKIPTFEPRTMQESDDDVSGTAPSTQPVENLDAETVRDELELEDRLSESEVQSSTAEPPSINESTDETLRERPTRMRNPPTRLVYNQLGRPQEQQQFVLNSIQPSFHPRQLCNPRLDPFAPLLYSNGHVNTIPRPLFAGPAVQNVFWHSAFGQYQ
eukprot:gene11484-12681_t